MSASLGIYETMASNKISIVVVSGKREQLQMAAMMASVGAVSGSEVVVFLSMNALPYFMKGRGGVAPPEGYVGELMERKSVTPFQHLFAQAVELGGAHIHPCSMAVDLLGIRDGDLETYLGEPMGLTHFLDDASSGQMLSF